MSRLLDAFWRAAAYCLHPRVVLLSIAPLLIAGGLAFTLGWFFWESSVDWVRAWLEGSTIVVTALDWLDSVGAGAFRPVIGPLIVVIVAVPALVVLSLLMVALLMTPSMVRMVASRRFPGLQRRHGAAAWQSAMFSIGCTLLALVMLVLSLPLWLVPPMVLVLPPLIWGWLTYKVMSFDALAEHASREELRAIVGEHRWPMMAMGVIAGYLGAAPSLIWAISATMLIFAPVLIVISIWLYTLVFAFSSLWFAHYALSALNERRRAQGDLTGRPVTTHAVALGPGTPADGSTDRAPEASGGSYAGRALPEPGHPATPRQELP